MSQKRERSFNFTKEDVDILIKLVEQKKDILENKKSDVVTWNQKEQCWKAIEVSFNATSTHRTSKNLPLKYKGIKRKTRKKSALIRAQTYRTGGGTSMASVLTPTESKVKNIILLSVDGMESTFDSDSVPNTLVSLPEPKASPHDVLDTHNLDKIIHSPSSQYKQNKENVEETPIHSVKRTLFETQDTADLEEAGEPKTKRPFENLADSKMKITTAQRQNKKEMWALEKKLLLKKINE